MTAAARWWHGRIAPLALGFCAAAIAVSWKTPAGMALLAAAFLAAAAIWAFEEPGRWLLLFFGALLLAPPLPGTSLHIAPVIAGIGLLAGALRWSAWRPLSGSVPLAMLVFLGVLAQSTAIALLYSGPEIAAGTLLRVLLFAQGVYVVLYTLLGPARSGDSLRTARFLFWMGLASALFACLDFHFQFPAPARYGPQFVWLQDAVLRRAQGVFYEASTLGNLCVFFLVMIVASMFQPRERAIASRPVLLAGGVVFGVALIFSYSRASILSLCAALAAFGCLRGATLWKAALATALPMAAAAAGLHAALPAISNSYWSRVSASFEYIASAPDGVLSGRLTSWTTLAGFLVHEPWHAILGIGYKTLPYSRFIGQTTIADNTYLSLLVETGIVGLAAFLLLNAAILRSAWRAAHSERGNARFLGSWIFCFWAGQMVQMFLGDLITYWRVLPVYFWVVAAAREAGEPVIADWEQGPGGGRCEASGSGSV
jgi:O-antigen ligase